MGNYINSNLVKEERVIYEAHYHWTVWFWPIVGCLFCCLPAIIMCNIAVAYNVPISDIPAVVWFLMLIGLAILILTYAKVITDEFAITTQRLIIKTGIFKRTTLELNLMKVETVSVSQGIIDRIFGGGTLESRGTGSTCSRIANVADPYEFRKAFQDAVDRYSNNKVKTEAPSATPIRENDSPQHAPCSVPSASVSNTIQALVQLKELLDSGVLSQEEFEAEKKKILNS